jgi:hypothetical protein
MRRVQGIKKNRVQGFKGSRIQVKAKKKEQSKKGSRGVEESRETGFKGPRGRARKADVPATE